MGGHQQFLTGAAATRVQTDLQSIIKQQRQQIREKDEMLEKLKTAQIPSHLNKEEVKKAM
jgi:hypothetical protein